MIIIIISYNGQPQFLATFTLCTSCTVFIIHIIDTQLAQKRLCMLTQKFTSQQEAHPCSNIRHLILHLNGWGRIKSQSLYISCIPQKPPQGPTDKTCQKTWFRNRFCKVVNRVKLYPNPFRDFDYAQGQICLFSTATMSRH